MLRKLLNLICLVYENVASQILKFSLIKSKFKLYGLHECSLTNSRTH